MAVNTQKFLPQSKSFSIVRAKTTKISPAKISLKRDIPPESTETDSTSEKFNIIKTKILDIDKLLKGTLASDKKELDDKKKSEEVEGRKKKEAKLEKKSKKQEDEKESLQLPTIGFFDRIKNYISNVLLGFFAVRMVDFLPQLTKLIPIFASVLEFLADFTIGFIDGVGTFLDWGYKLYDGSRDWAGKTFGEDALKKLDGFSDLLNKAFNLALIATTLSIGGRGFGKGFGSGMTPKSGFDKTGRAVSKSAQQRYFKKFGRDKFITRFGEENLKNLPKSMRRTAATKLARKAVTGILGTGGTKTGLNFFKNVVRPVVKRIPIIGGLIDFALNFFVFKEPVGRAAFAAIGSTIFGALGATAGSIIPVAGNIIGGVLGGLAGDIAGKWLYDTFFKGKQLSTSDTTTLSPSVSFAGIEQPKATKPYAPSVSVAGVSRGQSEASKLAGEAGRYVESKLSSPRDYQAITEHPEFGGIKGKHSKNSYHYAGRALDIGAYTYEQGPIIAALKEFNAKKGIGFTELITGADDPAGHGDHVHVAYAKGGLVDGVTYAMLGEKGKEFVIDADSTKALEDNFPGFLSALNKADYNGSLKVLRNYASYEGNQAQIIPVPIPIKSPPQEQYGERNSSGGGTVSFGSGSDPFETLYQGG
tara:strand:+ start:892 stop:2823 length:1932 start_codon:yes stop_codon:yes gene_type:complete